jgi:hypothetical protein
MVVKRCERLGFTLHTWNPGDGRKRYSFNRPGQVHIFALGASMAIAELDGWE